MENKWWIAVSVGVGVVVAATIGGGVVVNQRANSLTHPPALSIAAPGDGIVPAPAAVEDTPDFSALGARLRSMAADPRLGSFVGTAREVASGEVIWAQNPDTPVRPASATKILTATAALYELGWDDRITTEVVLNDAHTAAIRAAGDVTLSAAQLDDLAGQLAGRGIDTVLVDTSIWSAENFAPGWEDVDIDAGYIAPVEPVMLEGGRIGGTRGDLPRSRTPALDVAAQLASRIGAVSSGAGGATGTEVVASTDSETLLDRMRRMMEESDNVMAEALGREVAQHRGLATDSASTSALTLEILAGRGFDTGGVALVDNSGLSPNNLITPQLLDDILQHAATDEEIRPLLGTLPIAAGSGTLLDRYADLSGAGWVRAKTGTLTETSALAGTVTSRSGQVFTFAMVSTDSDILGAREAMDEMASALREF
ncbi:D-alanyl-D-alanine carboxypeptidase/D-alanyl-D-alanine endopeptidase [Corynebacterium pacaense]|uniref:D-alanyl-D-alanine carboxypeptidase/D-alanyl-D-alanine endopeptidase n=1 Tax=Corynebacterium pacaense TaxID=1816684 RepID=UPI0009B9619F|nr:D-alanyl-D-alanine carboxypeptidase/D-alanyl-D-alanine-endopeptidase [Corynebacterium pacaense]